MRKIILGIFFLAIPFCALAQKVQPPSGWVNDFAGVIDKEDSQKMTSLIEELRDKSSAEIMVVTISQAVKKAGIESLDTIPTPSTGSGMAQDIVSHLASSLKHILKDS